MANRDTVLVVGLFGAVALYAYLNQSSLTDIAQTGVDDVTAALTGWKNVQQGPKWVPVINAAETSLGIPTDLLARIAYQESHFRPDIISGANVSSAGALGLMQMLPQYFASVRVPTPFTDDDTAAQITEAGNLLASLYRQFSDWSLAVAAYNWGAGNVNNYLAGKGTALPDETATYVADVFGDVPMPTPQALV
jgi:soluble lytic murein transglycosylase-like protein